MELKNSTAYTSLPAEDMARAKKFYTEKLGLTLLMDQSPGMVLLGTNEQKIFIYQRGRSSAEHTALAFVVDDVKTTVQELIQKGVVFEKYEGCDELGVKTNGPMQMAWFKDPEGNILGVNNPFPI